MSSQQPADSSNDAIYVAGFLMLLYVVMVIFFGETIAAFHLKVREGWAALGAALFHSEKFELLKIRLETYAPREWMNTRGAIAQVSKDLRFLMFLPMGSIFGYYAYRVWTKNPGRSLRRDHTRKSLIKSEVRLWPWIAPVVDLDIVSFPIDSGKWAMAKKPVDFAKKYRLIDGREVNKIRTEKFFSSQLGKLWEGPEKLPSHVRALFACFIAQACRDKDGAREGLATLALSVWTGKPNYQFVEPLLQKHMGNKLLEPVFEKHAYVVTVLSAVLELARQTGVLPPAYFIWLRPMHRSLWYALNNVGRRTPFCETAGVHAHYLAEKVAGHRIERPYVIEAVKALERALREYKFD